MFKYHCSIILFIIVALFSQGCKKTGFYMGDDVAFSALSKNVATKITYGETDNNIRAINWTFGDKIRMYCPVAYQEDPGDPLFCDYFIPEDSNGNNIAKRVAPCTGQKLLRWNGDQPHVFSCVCPSPGDGVVTQSVSDGYWTGSIPATQQYNGGDYANLSPCMMLVGLTSCKSPQPSVDVDFYPVTTCLEFEMMNGTDYDLSVKEICLTSSGGEPLSGAFKVIYNESKTEYDSFEIEYNGGGTVLESDMTATVKFGETGFDFTKKVNNDGPKLRFKMFLNPASDITNPYLTIKAVRDDDVTIYLRTQLKLASGDVKIYKKRITPLTGILVKGGFILTSFGDPNLVAWDSSDTDITLGDDYEYFLDIHGSPTTLSFDDSGDELTKTVLVKSYKTSKRFGTSIPVKPTVDIPDGSFVSIDQTTDIVPTSEDFIYSLTFTASNNIAREGKTVALHANLRNAQPKTDSDLSSIGTANCYVVGAPGTYKIKVAYGNGTKYDTTYDGTTKTPSGSTAALLWCEPEGMITVTPTVSNGYISFSVNKESMQQGNALIALKSGSTITWSWHIWVTDKENLTAVPLGYYERGNGTAQFSVLRESTVTISSSPAKSITLEMKQGGVQYGLPVAGSDALKGCTYYQWGRKDPFLKTSGIDDKSERRSEISISVKNPTTIYLANYEKTSESVDWINFHPTDLWGETKTVFDPSPLGYKLQHITSKVSEFKLGCFKLSIEYGSMGRFSYVMEFDLNADSYFWDYTGKYTSNNDKYWAYCASKDNYLTGAGIDSSRANAYCVLLEKMN